jgi:hypothetical protein
MFFILNKILSIIISMELAMTFEQASEFKNKIGDKVKTEKFDFEFHVFIVPFLLADRTEYEYKRLPHQYINEVAKTFSSNSEYIVRGYYFHRNNILTCSLSR